MRTGSAHAARLAVGGVLAFHHVAFAIPDVGDALEVVAEGAWRAMDNVAICEVVPPLVQLAIESHRVVVPSNACIWVELAGKKTAESGVSPPYSTGTCG